MKALGIHVFAGGFTQGVRRVFNVEQQCETGTFGKESVEQLGIDWHQNPKGEWPVDQDAAFVFGNPRCTAFSTCTAGHKTAHGAFAPQTKDIIQLMNHSVGNYDVIVWESVQQAWTVGKPLLEQIVRELPDTYRVAHVMLNSASFGNPQNRKRYFFVAYRDHLTFNVEPPVMQNACSLADAIWDRKDRETRMIRPCDPDYDEDCWMRMSPDNLHTLKGLPSGKSLNWLADNRPEALHEKLLDQWLLSDKRHVFMGAFSIHRLHWLRHCPTIHGAAGCFVHPWCHRGMTVGELARCMGWEEVIPKGKNPLAQLAKGVVPELGEWLAHQVKDCLDHKYAPSDDCEFVAYRSGHLEEQSSKDKKEKFIDMTNWVAPLKEEDEYDIAISEYTRR